ncbi:unnamed protein product [Discula destructiva]
MDDVKHEVMVNYLYKQQCSNVWVAPSNSEGVLVRKTRGQYEACPRALLDSPFGHSMSLLNVGCAMTVNSRVIKSYLEWTPDTTEVPLNDTQRIQMVPTMADLEHARKAQCAAFVSENGLLVVWDDDSLHLMERATKIEEQLMKLVWAAGKDDQGRPMADPDPDKGVKRDEEGLEVDPETGLLVVPQRRVHVMNAFLLSLTLFAVICSIGAALRQISREVHTDGWWPRASLVCLAPLQITFTLFFSQVIFGSISQMFGPIRHLRENSRFYSGKLPRRLESITLPHVTIQCPVAKEGLEGVISPTVRSLKAAMTTYELQGGTCNLFINDDGLQIISKEERQARLEFYYDNNVAYVARPPHNPRGFQRRGKFKKASNMNYGLMVSNQVEEKLFSIHRGPQWGEADETKAREAALQDVLKELGGIAMAGGDVRMGDYILLVDSDTRVPDDCLLDAVSEMEQSPEVAILQFTSGVMQVVNHFFENGITFFTNLIYSAIRYTVANGDVAPFVGHNAIIRWSALQNVSYADTDRYEKFWSESHVSEDFDMSLRLQGAGYTIRLASWAGGGFQEGVSLTVYDELARWEKYAYGCNELLFNPIRLWFSRGPLTPLFMRFVGSGLPMTSKLTVIAYVGTYYAIAAAWILTTINYFLYGWWAPQLDRYYLDSWQVWFSIVIVFNGLGNLGLAGMRYRMQEKGLIAAIVENLKWTVMLAIFLGGLSLHLAFALLCHMFEIDMSWGSTSKEYERSNFWQEIPKILNKFKYTMAYCWIFIVIMIIMAVGSFIPWSWHITDFVAILPLATVVVSHILLPIALNPELMRMQF